MSAEPDARDAYTNLRVEADKLIIADQPTRTVKGLVLVQAPPFSDFRYGDRVRVEGKLQTPTDTNDFSYRDYLARQGVYSIMSRPRVTVLARDQGFAPLAWLYSFKARAKNVIAQILPNRKPRSSPASCSATIPAFPRVCKMPSARRAQAILIAISRIHRYDPCLASTSGAV